MIKEWGNKFSMRNNLSIICSNGWLKEFLEKNNFSLLKGTNKAVLSHGTLAIRGASFFKEILNVIIKYRIQ